VIETIARYALALLAGGMLALALIYCFPVDD
jgi:hypothetical protein